MSEVALLSLMDLAAHLQSGSATTREVVDHLLERIQRFQTILNAFVRIDSKEARRAATRADLQRARRQPVSRLAGVPLAHKDMFFRNGRISTCGSRLFSERIATETSTALRRLDRAGAIDLGTLHMSEFAHGSTGHNAFLGPARNPWNVEHITGGSSSGSAVAVSAGLAFAALGSDTGGSIRMPAHFCGVTGLKPTCGLVSRAGTMALSYSLDTVGVLARCVGDIAVVLKAIAGGDPRDPTAERRATPDFMASCSASVTTLTIGLPDRFYNEGLHPAVAESYDNASRAFERAGVRLRSVHLPEQAPLSLAQLVLVASEAASQHRTMLLEKPESYDPQIRSRLINGFAYSAQDYLLAARGRAHALFAHLEACADVDAILTPVARFPALRLDETEIGAGPGAEELVRSISHFMRPANYIGVPALALPAGFSQSGLPVGIQIVGRPFREDVLFALGAAFQRTTEYHRAHPRLD
jgi:aspartyl-tRNA(Asn)/glutamyl-tRNA(Gln) amidotransferase subunit A